MNHLSLRDKIGQMLIVGFEGSGIEQHDAIVSEIQNDNLGGVILFDFNFKTNDASYLSHCFFRHVIQ